MDAGGNITCRSDVEMLASYFGNLLLALGGIGIGYNTRG